MSSILAMHPRAAASAVCMFIAVILAGLTPCAADDQPSTTAAATQPADTSDEQAAQAQREAAFRKRADFYIRQLALQDADRTMDWAKRVWPRTGDGDPHKYVLPIVAAELALNPTDETAIRAYRRLMEEDRAKGDRGLYHFSTYLRTRIYGQFKPNLPEDIIASNEHDAQRFYHILTRPGGTYNHRTMEKSSAVIWADLVNDHVSRAGRDAPWAKQWFRDQVQRLYHVGMGEYDSSTYVGFTAASFANVYDFSPDPEMRAIAKAGLDWIAASMAVKYFHGATLGPESRGFAHEAVGARLTEGVRSKSGQTFEFDAAGANADWVAWLWFGDSAAPMPGFERTVRVNEHAVINLALSSYRPSPQIIALARKDVPLPFDVRASKPVYSGGRSDDGSFPGASKDYEVLHVAEHFAMGTLYSPEQGVRTTGTILPQTTMFKVLMRGPDDVHAFGMAQGYHKHFPVEGRGPFDQYHQHGAAAINIAFVDEVDRIRERIKGMPWARLDAQSILAVPVAAGDPVREGGWLFWQVGQAFLAARPLGGEARFQQLFAPARGSDAPQPFQSSTHRFVVSPGRLSGWVIQMGEQPAFADFAAFRATVIERCRIDASKFNETDRTVSFTSLAGDVLKLRHPGYANGFGGLPEAWTNGQSLSFGTWPVYESPYINQPANAGILRVSDGKHAYIVDYHGSAPKSSTTPVR